MKRGVEARAPSSKIKFAFCPLAPY